MPILEDARKELGQLFIVGFNGLELSDDTTVFLSQANIGGTILFSHNYENPAQLAELTNQIQECRRELPLWVAVDHEGGKVQRFRKGFTNIPSAAAFGRADSPKLTFEISEVIAKELKIVGINLNFAPVLDILTNPKNVVIGNRSFGNTEEQVSKISSAVVRGYLVNKLNACVKHFPGHGDTLVDSHQGLPKVETPLEVLQSREFRPFVKAFKSRCTMVMTAHIVYNAIDPEFPATLSVKVLRELLRKNLRYSRLIISDDMEMKAITDQYGFKDAPRLAFQAGCDILIYRSEDKARHAYENVIKAMEEGSLAPEIILEAVQRVKSQKKDSIFPYHPVSVADVGQKIGTPENQALLDKIPEISK